MQLNFKRVARSEYSRHCAQGLLHRGNVRALLQQKIGRAREKEIRGSLLQIDPLLHFQNLRNRLGNWGGREAGFGVSMLSLVALWL